MRAKLLSLALVFLFVAGPSLPVRALEDYSPEAIVTDAFIARPACFVVTIFGAAFFLVTLPATAIAGNTGRVADAMVGSPGRATFTRPMGDLSALR